MLVVPEAWNDPIGETVVIAWKDTVEAVRAVVAAQPFLIGIKHVKLVSVMEHSKDETGAAGMADYLSKADLRVERVDLAADGDAGPAVLEAATGRGVLLVMGAYGHWRWREWVFGGVTDYVLRNTGVPVLMMH